MIRMLTVVAAAALPAACGAPEVAPVTPAAAVSPPTASRTVSPTSQPTTQPLGVVPVDMGPAAAQEVAARAAAQAGNPPGAPPTQRQAAPKPAPKPVSQPSPKRPASGCNANDTPCVPDDNDVDCQGGSGHGPSHVRGPVQVIGSDAYGLDPDSDGIGCP
jgi:hypothetical protein